MRVDVVTSTGTAISYETPRLRFDAVEPGLNPATALGREANAFVRFLLKYVLPLLVPVIKDWSTPKQAARVLTKVVLDASGERPFTTMMKVTRCSRPRLYGPELYGLCRRGDVRAVGYKTMLRGLCGSVRCLTKLQLSRTGA